MNSVTPSSNPPGARSSFRTVPRIAIEDSAVTRSIASNDSGGTSFTPATHCRYPGAVADHEEADLPGRSLLVAPIP